MFVSRANSWISPVTERERASPQINKNYQTGKATLGTKAELLVSLENKNKKSTQSPQNQKSVTWFSLEDTHLHILECQALSAAPSIDRKLGSSTCHHTEDSHNNFHSRIDVQADVVAENSSTSDSASKIWLDKIEKNPPKIRPSNEILRC